MVKKHTLWHNQLLVFKNGCMKTNTKRYMDELYASVPVRAKIWKLDNIQCKKM